jgi:IS30 family transposase
MVAEPVSKSTSTKLTAAEQERRTRRFDLYEQVVDLHQQGISRRVIERQLSMHRSTVRRCLRREALPSSQ